MKESSMAPEPLKPCPKCGGEVFLTVAVSVLCQECRSEWILPRVWNAAQSVLESEERQAAKGQR